MRKTKFRNTSASLQSTAQFLRHAQSDIRKHALTKDKWIQEDIARIQALADILAEQVGFLQQYVSERTSKEAQNRHYYLRGIKEDRE